MSLLGDLGTAIKNKLGGTSVDNTVPRYNGTTCTMQGSGVTISDTNVVTASGGFVGNLTGNATTATTATNAEYATNAGYAPTAGRAYPRLSSGGDLNFHWSGRGGQPTWLWGGTDGANMYVYDPSNFSVNYANSAGSAGTSTYSTYMWSTTHSGSYYVKNWWTGSYWRLDSNHSSGCSVAHADYANSAGSVSASAVASGTAGIGTGGIGSYAFMSLVGAYTMAVGSTTAGSNLRYSCVNGSSVSDSPTAPSGTWRAMGNGVYNYLTLWLRIA